MASRAYCNRCDRWFRSDRAIQQHYNNSNNHNWCPICAFDGISWDELLEHHRSTLHKTVCQGCDNGNGTIWDSGSKEYQDHLEEENVCEQCERHFDSTSNLKHHRLVHLDRSVKCYGCGETFKTFSYMILHLDSRVCDSKINTLVLNITAAQCYQWRGYIDENYWGMMLEGRNLLEYEEAVYPFRYPECEDVFSKLSRLFQHVSSQTCPQTLSLGAIGKLVRWLRKQHG